MGRILIETLAKKARDVGVLETIGGGWDWRKLYLISDGAAGLGREHPWLG
jgi:hypothetical protein